MLCPFNLPCYQNIPTLKAIRALVPFYSLFFFLSVSVSFQMLAQFPSHHPPPSPASCLFSSPEPISTRVRPFGHYLFSSHFKPSDHTQQIVTKEKYDYVELELLLSFFCPWGRRGWGSFMSSASNHIFVSLTSKLAL